jgi:hypothetical protein
VETGSHLVRRLDYRHLAIAVWLFGQARDDRRGAIAQCGFYGTLRVTESTFDNSVTTRTLCTERSSMGVQVRGANAKPQ